MTIFGTEAPKYWAQGMSVVPLRVGEKRPIFNDWTQWKDKLPTPEEMGDWCVRYDVNNIGLVLGKQSNITVIDIDTTDPELEAAILRCLPPSPWVRVGAKGRVLAYKWNGHSTKRIHDTEDRVVFEILSAGSQVALPPSIHPTTKMPYTSNCNLFEVIDQLVTLPIDFEEKVRHELSKFIKLKDKSETTFKINAHVPLGARDMQMNRAAGRFSYSVFDKNNPVPLLRAFDLMQSWFDDNVEKVQGDNIDVGKGMKQILQYVIHDVTVKGKMLPTGWDEGLTPEQKKEWGLEFDAANEEWTFAQIEQYIQDAIKTAASPNDPKIHLAVDFILQKMAKSQGLNEVDIERIYQLMRTATRNSVSVAAYKRRVRELQRGPIAGENHTEIAEAVIDEFNRKYGQIAFHQGILWRYSGSHWEVLNEQELLSVIAREYGALTAAKKANDHAGVVKIVKMLVPQTIKKIEELIGINFANGFMGADMRMVPHSADYGMTYTLPFRYNPEVAAKFPMFNKVLHDAWAHNPDYEQKRIALQQMICAILFGMGTKLQRAFLLYGVGSSGKSVIMNIISDMVPKEARQAVKPEDWHDKFLGTMLTGCLLNVAGELSESARIDGASFKQIVAGEEMMGQHKFGQLFKFRPIASHLFASNYLPKTKDTSDGFNRRWLILYFDRAVPESERVIGLSSMIVSQEMEAIVAWALEAMPNLVANNFTLPASHHYYADEMAMANSTVRQWMAERVVNKEGAVTKDKDFYLDYWKFCTKIGGGTLKPKQFSLELHSILAEKGRNQPTFAGNDPAFGGVSLVEKQQ